MKYVVYVIYIKVQFLDTTPQISTQACVYKLLQVPSAFDMRFLLRDVLCSDKTGTLTSEQTTLALEGEFDYTSHDVLKLAYANSYFQVCPRFVEKSILHTIPVMMQCLQS